MKFKQMKRVGVGVPVANMIVLILILSGCIISQARQMQGISLQPSKQQSASGHNIDHDEVQEPKRTIFNPRKESLDEFLTKYPPSKTKYEQTPWIQLVKPNAFDPRADPDSALDEFKHRAGANNIKSTDIPQFVRYLGRKYLVTLGKWMLYYPPKEIDAAWKKISHAMFEGKLYAPTAKVAPSGHPYQNLGHLICVYTYNFRDLDDVMKIRKQLYNLGFTQPLDYKADIYTNLGIYENNEWGISENMFRK